MDTGIIIIIIIIIISILIMGLSVPAQSIAWEDSNTK